MKVVFFTQEYCMGRKNGAQHYSASIIDSLVDMGVDGLIIVLRESSGLESYRGWSVLYNQIAPEPSGWKDNISFLPRMVVSATNSFDCSAVRKVVDESDIVFIDHLACAGVLRELGPIPYVYIAHNDETESKRSFVSTVDGILYRLAHRLDLMKIDRFQSEVENGAVVVTAISERDYQTTRARGVPENKLHLLEPWREAKTEVSTMYSRSAVIAVVGTFEWTPKRLALWRLIDVFKQVHSSAGDAASGVKLRIAGRFHKDDTDRLAQVPGSIECIRDYREVLDVLHDVRIGLLIDGAGAGFKIKLLDYLQAGCAIYTLSSDVFMSGMKDKVNCRISDDLEAVIKSAVREVSEASMLDILTQRARRDFKGFLSPERFSSAVREIVRCASSIE